MENIRESFSLLSDLILSSAILAVTCIFAWHGLAFLAFLGRNLLKARLEKARQRNLEQRALDLALQRPTVSKRSWSDQEISLLSNNLKR